MPPPCLSWYTNRIVLLYIKGDVRTVSQSTRHLVLRPWLGSDRRLQLRRQCPSSAADCLVLEPPEPRSGAICTSSRVDATPDWRKCDQRVANGVTSALGTEGRTPPPSPASLFLGRGDVSHIPGGILIRTVVFTATAAAICSLGYGLCTFTAVPRSTQPSIFR